MTAPAVPGASDTARSPAAANQWRWALGALATLGCLAAAAVHMSPEWTLNETYHYGWLVPALAAYLVSLRWRDRPPGRPPSAERPLVWALPATALLVLWIVREANPDWRLVGLGLAGVTVVVALLWMQEAGGSRWARHFAGAFGFLLLAAPWPSTLETAVTAPLMSANAGLALEALHWLGVPAVRSGSLITLPGGTLGVEEACSGIRSLQATVMMALFLGEMNALRWRDRGLLLALGAAVALLTNVGRTVWLSVLAAGPDPAAADRWHDSAGLLVLALHVAVLLAAAHLLERRRPATRAAATPAAPPRWPVRGPSAMLACLALLAPLTALWYGRHPAPAPPAWTLRPPASAPNYEVTPIPPRTRQILRHEAGWSARWRTPAGHQLHGFFLTWGTGQVRPEILDSHDPGGCLTLAGMSLIRTDPEPLNVEAAPGWILPVRCLEFSDRGRPLYVFHAVEETTSRGLERDPAEDLTRRSRWRGAWMGRRSESLRLIEIGIWNAADAAEAREVVAAYLHHHLEPSPPADRPAPPPL